ncbi:hypothetical protein N9O57_00020 [bacterium]|nr:hypothetical protein [bacterium]
MYIKKLKHIVHHSEGGFTIMGAIVAVGVIAVGAIFLISLQNNSMRVSKTINAQNDITTTVSEVRTLLSNPVACKKSFETSSASAGTDTLELLNENDESKFRLDMTIGTSTITYFKLDDSDSDVNVRPGEVGDTYLKIGFNKGDKTLVSDIERRVKLKVETDSLGNITECRSFSSGDSQIWRRSSTNFTNIFYADGSVGIGTTGPKATLDVGGDIKLGDTSASCTSDKEGAIRYSSTTKNMEFCNGSVWSGMGGSQILSHGNLRRNYNSKTQPKFVHSITTSKTGVISLSGTINRVYNGGGATAVYAGARMYLYINSQFCGGDYSLFREAGSVSYHLSASCHMEIPAGTHEIRIDSYFGGNQYATTAIYSMMSWKVMSL